ncbi:MAG: FHA domain-containing protein, partial [Bdellovibrionales bacterium]|nr:FHA domain-containing protein [Bdellovibrionales bacterium]
MAHIVVQLHGQEISRLELEQGHEYLVGRAEDIAICLPPEKGISRHHLKIYQKDSIWFVELLARFGSLYLNGNKLSAIELKETTHFSSPPFEFDFVVPIQQIETHLPSLREDGAPPKQVALSHHAMVPIVQNEGIPQGWPTQEDLQGNSEMTVVAKKQLTPFLKISSEQNLQEETIKLEGQLWVAGRDPHCEIPLADHRASRRHFEISHTEEGFFITDLNSANGTLLNEEPITPNESWQLTSGDVIQVSKVKLIFEVRDLSYSNQLPALLSPQQEANALSQYVPMGSQPFYPQSQLMSSSAHLFSGASVIKLESPNHLQWKNPQTWKLENFKKIDFKKNRVKILIGIMIPFILIGLIPQKEKRVELPSTTPTFDKLTVEQKRAVKDSFNLAKSMFMQGKYELCLSEIQKLHGVVPSYENSNEIKDYCKQGADLALLQRDKERRDQAKAESNRLITQTVED